MAIGPRLDLRHSQTLVMTPQLRQAIKLLQFSNVEVSAFIEEELERNPLLERDERSDSGPGETPAPDQLPARNSTDTLPDTAVLAQSDILPERSADPLDADFANSYDPGGPADGARSGGGAHDFDQAPSGIEELATTRPSLREHLGEQL